MNIYVIASTDNLKVFKKSLTEKFDTVNIQGTNNLLEGIDIVTNRHITEEYDLFLILNQRFIEEDLASKQEISSKLNKACVYALKDLPIYLMVNESNKELREGIQNTLTGRNVKIYPYKKLNIKVVEDIIKEVLVLHEQKPKNMNEVQRDIIQERKRIQQRKVESHVDRIYETRSKRDEEDFSSLTRIKSIIDQYTSPVNIRGDKVREDNSSRIISEIKSKLFEENKQIVPDIKDTLKIKSLNHSVLSEKISPTKIRETLTESNQTYNDYGNYMETLKEIIEKVKASEEPNKHELVLELMREKSVANNEMHEILSQFLTEVTKNSIDFITTEYNKDINELHEYGKYENVDTLIGAELDTIEEMKRVRSDMKVNVGYMIEELATITNHVNQSLSLAGQEYLKETKLIEQEMQDYANENNVTLGALTVVKNPKVITTLQQGYAEVKEATTGLISASNRTIHKLVEILNTDEKIIEKQEDVIDVLMTQKTKKVITVDNILQTKLCAIVGPDGVGKTHTGINMAYSESKMHRTLLLDMNINNPNLLYYNRTEEPTTDDRWLNRSTITLEEFIYIPIGKYMHEQIPFHNNLTIIQPKDVVDLELYESVVNPKVFALHLRGFLERLADFYDKIIIILPQNLEMFHDILTSVGTMYMVNNYDPSNIMKVKEMRQIYFNQFENIPVKYFIANMTSRNVKIGIKEYLEMCDVDTREYSYFTVPDFQESVQCKLEGKIPAENNINTRKVFDELVKR